MSNVHCDHLIDYFNGHLTNEEKEQFEKHLSSCEECQTELAEWNALADDLPYESEEIEPPEGMRERVLTHVFAEEKPLESKTISHEKPVEKKLEKPVPFVADRKKRPAGSKWLIPAAAVLLLSLGANAYLFSELQTQSTELAETQESIDELLQFVQLTPIEGENGPSGTASIVRNGSEINVVINASSLGPLQEEEVYQVWLIDDEAPQRAGTFKSNESGTGTVVFEMDVNDFDLEQWNQIAISQEPDANSETPLGDVVMASEI
ncbi:anti-sigma factor [Jeotgalibacillus aurantiacus]|uniref:anti-sigma factor n=1 Tax=Jeotgalibacillus aurantiacus TaxID=2763266 RepID=UPI001D0AE784|nr:anti-sigma factor [Jeotgalibacillus aurantiacus]